MFRTCRICNWIAFKKKHAPRGTERRRTINMQNVKKKSLRTLYPGDIYWHRSSLRRVYANHRNASVKVSDTSKSATPTPQTWIFRTWPHRNNQRRKRITGLHGRICVVSVTAARPAWEHRKHALTFPVFLRCFTPSCLWRRPKKTNCENSGWGTRGRGAIQTS